MMNKICNALIVVSGISLILGIITRILVKPIIYGITAQAYLRFGQTLLLFD